MSDIENTLQIGAYIHCGKCLEEWKAGSGHNKTPQSYQLIEVGFTKRGIQVWCRRHKCNVMHMDFQGHKHPANTTRAGE